MKVAIIKNNIVENVILVDSIEQAQSFFPDYSCISADDLVLGIGFYQENNIWYPPKPSNDHVWDEQLGWILLENFVETPPFEPSIESN